MKTYNYDVVVVGGGPAGVCASLAAAREGSKVLIVEQYGVLGGMSSMGLVNPWMTFHDVNGNQVVKGIAQEIVDVLKTCNMCTGHVADTMGETFSVTPFDNEGLKYVLAQMCKKEGIDLLFHTFVFGCRKDRRNISSLRAANKNGEIEIKAKVYIDASGDGDVFAFSGCESQLGRSEDHLTMPCTTNFQMYNVDFAKIRDFMIANPKDFHFRTDMSLLKDGALPESISGFFEEWKNGCAELGIDIQRERILFFRGVYDDIACINTTRLCGINATDADSMSFAEVELRKQVYQVSELLQKYVPGFENARILSIAPVVGIREGRRLVGEYVLTGKDVREARKFEDGIATYGYPIDQHDPCGAGFTMATVQAYEIPYRSIVPKELDNLLVTGRCISCDREAQSSLRTTPGVMAIGEASGIAASIIASKGIRAKDVNSNQLRDKLKKNGAYIL